MQVLRITKLPLHTYTFPSVSYSNEVILFLLQSVLSCTIMHKLLHNADNTRFLIFLL